MNELAPPEESKLSGKELRDAVDNLKTPLVNLIPDWENRMASQKDLRHSGGDVIKMVEEEFTKGDTKFKIEAESPHKGATALDTINILKKSPELSVIARVQFGDVPQVFYMEDDFKDHVIIGQNTRENVDQVKKLVAEVSTAKNTPPKTA
jgi:hypothetical protein